MYHKALNNIISNSQSVFKGKSDKVKLVLCNVLAGGHTLIEDTPGVGKTTMVKYLSHVLGLELSRIQFTNDLLPSDILGSSIFNKVTNQFDFHKGPIFGEIVLADELNRAPPKTQSALLQAMEEKSINIDGSFYELPEYFIVMATQNPNAQLGTFALPESQLDRFSMKIDIGHTDQQSTIELLKEVNLPERIKSLQKELTPAGLLEIQSIVQKIHLDDEIYELIYRLLDLSRTQSQYQALSNRCGLDIVRVAKAMAYIDERDYVIPDDVIKSFPYIAGHRLTHGEHSNIKHENEMALSLIERL